MKVGIGIPCPDRVHPDFMMNLVDIVKHTKQETIVRKETGVRTDRNRNELLQQFIKDQVQYILWLDADMIYPNNIVETYLKAKADVIGCLYFRRERPHLPIGYIDSGEKENPYRPMLPQMVHFGKIYNVKGLGFGGMMVNMKVYHKLKKKKWMNYGKYFHIPKNERNEKQKLEGLTHDLQLCKNVLNHGFKLKLHGSVRPSHIGDKFVTAEDYSAEDNIEILRPPKTLIVIVNGTKKTAKLLKDKASMPCRIVMAKDNKGQGFIKTVFDAIKQLNDYELYVCVSNKALPKKNWLLEAIICQGTTGAGMVAFNDSFCMLEKQWLDDEKPDFNKLEKVAKKQRRFAFAEKAIVLEK